MNLLQDQLKMKLIIFWKPIGNFIMFTFTICFVLLISFYVLDYIPLDIAKGAKGSTIEQFSSIGVNALAGVLAIVITVTLIVVQLSSQVYSRRIMEHYIKRSMFMPLIIIYIITICFNVVILNWGIPVDANTTINTKIINISILLTLLCFLLLIPHSLFTPYCIQPAFIIESLLNDVDKNYLKRIQKKWNNGRFPPLEDKDNVLGVRDIIAESMKSNDRLIINKGLEKMGDCYRHLISSKNDNMHLRSTEASKLRSNSIKDVISDELHKVFKTEESPQNINIIKVKDCKCLVYIGKKEEKKIYIIKKEGDKLNFYDNIVPAYFVKHFYDIAEIAMQSSDDDIIERILENFEKMTKEEAYDDATADLLIYALHQIAKKAINQKLMAVTKISIIEKFVEVVKVSRKREISKLIALGDLTSEQEELEQATCSVLKGLFEFKDASGLFILGEKAARNGQEQATEEAISRLIELKKVDNATKLILEATNHELEIHYQAEKIGECKCQQIFEDLSWNSVPKDDNDKLQRLKDLGSSDRFCNYKVKCYSQDEICLVIKSSYIKTLKNFDDWKIRLYCSKTRSNYEQGRDELPVCKTTFSYLEEAIKRITGKEAELKRPIGWDKNGFCVLTFKLKELTHSVVPSVPSVPSIPTSSGCIT